MLEKYVDNFFVKIKLKTKIDKFYSGEELLNKSCNGYYDLILLDIDMPELNGFNVSSELRKKNAHTDIIFISGRDNFVFQSLKYRPFRFIRKTCIENELNESLNDFLEYLGKKNAFHTFCCGEKHVSVKLSDIIYFECYNHDITLKLNNGYDLKLNRHYSLRTIEEDFSKYGFIRTHKSYITNYRFINFIKDNDIILSNGEILPSVKKRIPYIRERLNSLIMEDI